jgi:Reverse transcriptase (RNA-dependent DNA polymerase)
MTLNQIRGGSYSRKRWRLFVRQAQQVRDPESKRKARQQERRARRNLSRIDRHKSAQLTATHSINGTVHLKFPGVRRTSDNSLCINTKEQCQLLAAQIQCKRACRPTMPRSVEGFIAIPVARLDIATSPISVSEIRAVLADLKHKATDATRITERMVYLLLFCNKVGHPPWLAYYFTHCLSLMLTDQINPPENFRRTSIVPIPKDNSLLANRFRPIQLLHPITKILMRVILSRMKNSLVEVVSCHQYAFMPKRSPHRLIEWTSNELVNDRIVIGTDVSGAYDAVDWRILWLVLKRFFTHKSALVIHAWLRSGQFTIRIDGKESEVFHRHEIEGIAQGDPLAPIIFILLMSTIFSCVGPMIRGYADDCFMSFDSLDSAQRAVDRLQVIMQWFGFTLTKTWWCAPVEVQGHMIDSLAVQVPRSTKPKVLGIVCSNRGPQVDSVITSTLFLRIRSAHCLSPAAFFDHYVQFEIPAITYHARYSKLGMAVLKKCNAIVGTALWCCVREHRITVIGRISRYIIGSFSITPTTKMLATRLHQMVSAQMSDISNEFMNHLASSIPSITLDRGKSRHYSLQPCMCENNHPEHTSLGDWYELHLILILQNRNKCGSTNQLSEPCTVQSCIIEQLKCYCWRQHARR